VELNRKSQPPHPLRPLHPQLITTLPAPPSTVPIPPRLRVPVPAQALPVLRRHLAHSQVQPPPRPNNPLLRLARLKLLVPTIMFLPVVSPSQAGALATGRTSPSTICTRQFLVWVLRSKPLNPSWFSNVLNVPTLTYIPNTTILHRFILLVTCLSYIIISCARAGSLVGSEMPGR
jgi:hypothetical protein